jgi:predicted PurR-regulated permease PerM
MPSSNKPLSTRKHFNHDEARDVIPGSLAIEAEMMNGRCGPLDEDIRSSLAKLARIAILLLGTLAIAYAARSVVVPVLLAWVGSMALNSPVRWLGQCHLPRPVGAAVVVGIFVLAAGYGGYRLGRPAVEWAKSAPEHLPALREKFKRVLGPAARLSAAASKVSQLDASDGTSQKPQPVEVKDNRVAGSIFSWTGSMLAGIGETIALLFLLLASGDLFLQKLVEVMPTRPDKKKAVQLSREIQQSISGYLFSVGVVNVAFGTLVGFSLHWLGLPNAAMWGGVAAFLNFIPYFGPIVGMIAVTMAGLLAFDTLGPGLLPGSAYLLLHLVEANLVTPFVLGRRCALNPVLIFVSLMFFGWLWGVPGALLAVPLLVTAKVVCDRITVLSSLGQFLSA